MKKYENVDDNIRKCNEKSSFIEKAKCIKEFYDSVIKDYEQWTLQNSEYVKLKEIIDFLPEKMRNNNLRNDSKGLTYYYVKKKIENYDALLGYYILRFQEIVDSQEFLQEYINKGIEDRIKLKIQLERFLNYSTYGNELLKKHYIYNDGIVENSSPPYEIPLLFSTYHDFHDELAYIDGFDNISLDSISLINDTFTRLIDTNIKAVSFPEFNVSYTYKIKPLLLATKSFIKKSRIISTLPSGLSQSIIEYNQHSHLSTRVQVIKDLGGFIEINKGSWTKYFEDLGENQNRLFKNTSLILIGKYLSFMGFVYYYQSNESFTTEQKLELLNEVLLNTLSLIESIQKGILPYYRVDIVEIRKSLNKGKTKREIIKLFFKKPWLHVSHLIIVLDLIAIVWDIISIKRALERGDLSVALGYNLLAISSIVFVAEGLIELGLISVPESIGWSLIPVGIGITILGMVFVIGTNDGLLETWLFQCYFGKGWNSDYIETNPTALRYRWVNLIKNKKRPNLDEQIKKFYSIVYPIRIDKYENQEILILGV